MRLLLVEDDPMIGEAVQDLLRAEHYAVDWVRDGDAADTALRANAYDLVMLDLGLPKRDGIAVLRDLRTRKDRTPVLVATARDAVAQRIEGLDAGADDYVLKPYDLDELLARIRALLRRAAGRAEPVYEHKGVSINPTTREATVNGVPVVLSAREWAVLEPLLARLRALARRASGGSDPLYEREGVRLNPATREASVDGRDVVLSGREWAVLETLLARPGSTLSRQQIEDKLYGWGDEVSSNAIEVYIHGLRKKLGAGLILNVRGVGYMVPKP